MVTRRTGYPQGLCISRAVRSCESKCRNQFRPLRGSVKKEEEDTPPGPPWIPPGIPDEGPFNRLSSIFGDNSLTDASENYNSGISRPATMISHAGSGDLSRPGSHNTIFAGA